MNKNKRRQRQQRQIDRMKRYGLDRLLEISKLSDFELSTMHKWDRHNLNEAIQQAQEDSANSDAMHDMYGDEADYLMENMPDIGNK